MRKEYRSPLSVVVSITTDNIITASNGDVIQEKVSDGTTIDGGSAWSRRSQNRIDVWELEDDEEDGVGQ